MEKKNTKKNQTFETSLNELEEIVIRLENGDLGLDESIEIFEKGVSLAKFCHNKLEEAERKIEILQKNDNGKIIKKQISIDSETGEFDDTDMQGSLL